MVETAKVYLLLSLLGLLILSTLVFVFPNRVKICEIDQSMVGDVVLVRGTVTSERVSGSNTFMVIGGDCEVSVVFFRPVSVEEGNLVEVRGEVNKYEGELEIIGKSINLS